MRNMVNFSATIAFVACAAYAQAIGAADAAGSGYRVGDRLTEKPNTPATNAMTAKISAQVSMSLSYSSTGRSSPPASSLVQTAIV